MKVEWTGQIISLVRLQRPTPTPCALSLPKTRSLVSDS